MTTAAELRESIVIQEVTTPFADDNTGVVTTTFATAWAKIIPTTSNRAGDILERQESIQAFEITIRYIAGVTAFMQILWGARILVITAPPLNVGQANRWLIIQAEETVKKTF